MYTCTYTVHITCVNMCMYINIINRAVFLGVHRSCLTMYVYTIRCLSISLGEELY